jgi:nitrogen regulatory protein PII
MTNASLIVSFVRKGWGSTVLEASVKAGARGGTVLFGRGAGINEHEKIFGMSIEPEKEIVLTVVYADLIETVLAEIVRSAELSSTGKGIAFVVPIDKVVGVAHFLCRRSGQAVPRSATFDMLFVHGRCTTPRAGASIRFRRQS